MVVKTSPESSLPARVSTLLAQPLDFSAPLVSDISMIWFFPFVVVQITWKSFNWVLFWPQYVLLLLRHSFSNWSKPQCNQLLMSQFKISSGNLNLTTHTLNLFWKIISINLQSQPIQLISSYTQYSELMTSTGLEDVVSEVLRDTILYNWGHKIFQLFWLLSLPALTITYQGEKRIH
jgi:hypothetical protein